MITYDLNLCLGKNNSDKRLAVKCHDTGVKLRVYLQVCRHGKWRDEYDPYIIPSGTTAVLKIVKPDKKYCITEGVVESDDILFAMNPQAFTTAGISQAEVSLFGPDGKRITSGTFDIEVPEECICGCDLESENYIDVMSEQIRAAIDAADRAEAAVTHGPIIKGVTWWLWNPEQSKYEDSGVCASADQGVVKTVNGISPDANGNVEILVSGGNVDQSGLTNTEKTLILSLFQNAVFTSDVSAILAQLETLWSNNGEDSGSGEDGGGTETPTFYIVTNKLTNVATSNHVASVESGNSYTATLTAEDGYDIESVTVTMGGTDITNSAYSDGIVNIASVTGNVVITAVAKSSVNITQDGGTLIIVTVPNVTQDSGTLIIS